MFEAYMEAGKAHALYGRLTDLRTMLVECFDALRSCRGLDVPTGVVHHIEHPEVVPDAIATKVGYNIESTLHLLTESWTDHQIALLELFPVPVRDGMFASKERPTFGFMTEDLWYDSYHVALEHFDMSDPDWHQLLFRLWTVRVIAYTTSSAVRGYGYAMRSLRNMVNSYLRRSALGS
jgi:mannosylglycerate synthase